MEILSKARGRHPRHIQIRPKPRFPTSVSVASHPKVRNLYISKHKTGISHMTWSLESETRHHEEFGSFRQNSLKRNKEFRTCTLSFLSNHSFSQFSKFKLHTAMSMSLLLSVLAYLFWFHEPWPRSKAQTSVPSKTLRSPLSCCSTPASSNSELQTEQIREAISHSNISKTWIEMVHET